MQRTLVHWREAIVVRMLFYLAFVSRSMSQDAMQIPFYVPASDTEKPAIFLQGILYHKRSFIIAAQLSLKVIVNWPLTYNIFKYS